MILSFAILCVLTRIVIGHRSTPCPEMFLYETKEEKGDRWYGQIKYVSPKNITGIWLHITLDNSADLLGNWFGQVTTVDNTVYVIRNPDYRVIAGVSLNVQFFVKYNLAQVIPSLKKIKLNGNVICSRENELKPVTPKQNLFQTLPTVLTTTNKPKNEDGKKQEKYVRPNSPFSLSVDEHSDSETESDPPGDFDIIKVSPQSRIASGTKDAYKSSNCGVSTALDAKNMDDTRPGRWPWHGALYRTQETNLVYVCGITLITEQHVIVPAHCITKFHTEQVKQPNNFLIVLGKYYLNQFGSEVQQRSVSDIFLHNEYNHSVYINDIAVLKLSKSVKITDFVRPCCLWENDEDSNDINGKKGTIVGWGLDERHRLLQAELSVVPLEDCFFPQSTLGRNYCAEFKNATDSCKVKSIGGMVFPKEGTDGQNTVWQIRGINIFSEIQMPCDKTKTIIFTDVAKYTTWIKQVISDSD